MSSESITYFNRAVMKYSRGDVVALLSDKIRCAGPLLSITVNGIDLTGGICFGFGTRSRDRSEKFMVEHMDIRNEWGSGHGNILKQFIKYSNFSLNKVLNGHFGGSKHTFKRKARESGDSYHFREA